MKLRNHTRRITLLAVPAVLAAGLFAGCGGGGPQMEEEKPIPVSSSVVTSLPAVVQRDLSGVLRGEMEANVAPEVSGRLRRINVEVGDEVVKGQSLAVIDGSQYWLSSQASKGQMETARLQLEQAQDNYDRYKPLYESDKISQAQWDQIVNGLEMAEAGYEAAKAGYYQVTDMAAETTIRSPLTGVVASRNADIGSMVGPQMVVFQVVQTEPMKVTIGVNESDLRYLTEDSPVELRVEAYPGETFTGTVRGIGAKLDERTHTFPVEISVPNPDGRLKSGMVAHAVLSIRDLGEVISVPLNAVIEFSGTKYVYVVHEVERSEPRPSARQLRAGEETVYLNSTTDEIAEALDSAGAGTTVSIESEEKLYTLTLDSIGDPPAAGSGDPGTELRVERREVTTGPTLGDRIVIETGLESGERIVTEGQQFLDDETLISLPDEDLSGEPEPDESTDDEATTEDEQTPTDEPSGEEAA
jgi:RND family efflux transporter MFP subunit